MKNLINANVNVMRLTHISIKISIKTGAAVWGKIIKKRLGHLE